MFPFILNTNLIQFRGAPTFTASFLLNFNFFLSWHHPQPSCLFALLGIEPQALHVLASAVVENSIFLCDLMVAQSYTFEAASIILFFFLWYWSLNSGPLSHSTSPFFKGFFELGSCELFVWASFEP
jgi:hypothetical protein